MDASAFNGIARTQERLFFAAIVFVPLGTWKAVDIVLWATRHISFH